MSQNQYVDEAYYPGVNPNYPQPGYEQPIVQPADRPIAQPINPYSTVTMPTQQPM